MNILSDFSESLITEEKRQKEKQTEAFEITSVEITPLDKLDGVVTNTGQVPLGVKTLWIEETGTPDSVRKFDIGEIIAPGNQVNLLDIVDFDMDSTKGYTMKMISDRGTIKTFYVNSVGSSSLYVTARSIPPTISNSFDATILMRVTNNSTNPAAILNLTPTEFPTIDDSTCIPDCSATYVSGPTPSFYPRLKPGETAAFTWTYTIEGINSNQIHFTTSLENGIPSNTATTTVEVRDILSALESGTAISSLGLQSNGVDSSILILHEETDRTPSGQYQMFSASPDGGSNGLKIDLDSTPATFFTNTGSNEINIPAGDWVTSLRLQSEAMPDSLVGEGEDMIFHFNTNSEVQDNSEGSSDRDIQGCASFTETVQVNSSSDDAEQRNPSGTTDTGSSDLEMPYDGNEDQYVGMRFTNIDIPKNAIISKAYLTFRADSSDSDSITLKFDAEATDDATTFSESSNNLSPSNRPRTSASANWSPENWSNNNYYSTPDTLLNSVIQEIVNRAGWNNNQDINIFVERVSGSSNDKRRADSYDTGGGSDAPILTIEYSVSGAESPTYSANGGPHGSGAYVFNGVNTCFRSINDVSSSNGNDITSKPDTTTLWFKTAAAVGSTDQHMVAFEGSGTCPSCDYYRIFLEANTGKVVFEFNMDVGGSDTTTCKSVNRYDDQQWYHIAAVRKSQNDRCDLYVTDLAGNTLETINENVNHPGTDSVDTDGKWYIGSNSAENGNWFHGMIDDVIHWNNKELSASPEVLELARTNYGIAAHKINISFTKSDFVLGINTETIATAIDLDVPFYDSMGNGVDDDSTYGVFNYTIPLSNVTMSNLDRLNFTVNYVESTPNVWYPLQLNFKIDDETHTPTSSLIQIPPPDTPFISYWTYDKSDRLEVTIYNVGPEGSWLVYQGTRAVFKDPDGDVSYAGIICSVNSTESDPCNTGGGNNEWRVDEDRDSIFIPVDNIGKIYFWDIQNRPDRDVSGGTEIPAGEYDMFVFINGYDEEGSTFLRNLEMGRVKVQD
ncbi:LamG-like jellyroll fold domain-containing protein [Nitrosarchaeum sp.]|uniref:LamG-like jellyroll fold domain-containing protein n=1 Tax=Nitrosarchaeum sp. TaxID=2026886 RepID=UPI00247BCDC1|nr:LamG-like jellyroll fold domain-containing protein [Nitrosarchaeum sp.]MCV0411557.1 LamG domain-containing protein [Nitrosarchaeum sp.]